MGWKSEPNADDIVSLIGRLRSGPTSTGTNTSAPARSLSGQEGVDETALSLYMQRNALELMPTQSPNMKPRPVGSGLAGLMVDQDVSVLAPRWRYKVFAVGGADAEEHVSQKLEPFLDGALSVIQTDYDLDYATRRDIRIFGRSWWLGPLPAPQFWGDETMLKLSEALEKADSEDRRKELRGEIENWKKRNFPIVARHWDARSTWPVFNDRGLAEVVHVHMMSVSDIKDRWGYESEAKGEAEVYEYVNHEWMATVIPSKKKGEDAQTLQRYKHSWTDEDGVSKGIGTIPVTLFEAGRLPPNQWGIMWAGALFHLRELLPAIDETFSDIRTNARENVTAPPVVFQNVEARQQLEGWSGKPVEVKQGETVNLIAGETVLRFPVNQITADVYQFLQLAERYADRVGASRPALTGSTSPGESAVRLVTANQISKAELAQSKDGLLRGGVRAGQLIARSVIALSDLYPDAEDKVYVRVGDRRVNSREIATTPADWREWLHLIDAQMDLNLPQSEAGEILSMATALNARIYDPITVREKLGHSDPQQVDRRWLEWEADRAIGGLLVALIQQRAGVILAGAGGGALNGAATLPDVTKDVLRESMESDGRAPPPEISLGQPNAAAATNSARTGRQQTLSSTSATGGAPQDAY